MAAAEAFTTAGKAECAVAQAHQAMAVCRTTRSTRLARALHRAYTQMRDTWPTHAAVRELGEQVYPLTALSTRWPSYDGACHELDPTDVYSARRCR